MQPLEVRLREMVDHLHTVVDPTVFVELCREFWDRMGQVSRALNFYHTRYNISLLNWHVKFNFLSNLISVGCTAYLGG